MLLNPKPRRRQLTKIIRAPLDIKRTIALLALKMMVMSLVRPLVASGFSGYFDRFNPTFGQQRRDRTVDSRNSQTLDPPRRRLEQLVNA
jgi:hypothetical protein